MREKLMWGHEENEAETLQTDRGGVNGRGGGDS